MSTKRTRTTKPATTATKTTPAKPEPKPAPTNCGCGCGKPTISTKARFLAGHDARHAGNIARALVADPTDKQARDARDRSSERLQSKIDGLVTAWAEQKRVKDAKAAAKAAYESALAAV